MGTSGAVPGVPASPAAGSRQERGPAVSGPVSGSVVPSGSGGLSRYDQSGRQLDWRTRQELSRLEQERSLTRAVVDAAEEEEAHAVGQVLAHGERLAHQAVAGLLYGDSRQFMAQLIGVIVNVVFVFSASFGFFKLVERVMGNRVAAEVEWNGLDEFEMGAEAYRNS